MAYKRLRRLCGSVLMAGKRVAVQTLYRSWPAVSLQFRESLRDSNTNNTSKSAPNLELDGGLVIQRDGLGQEGSWFETILDQHGEA